MKEILELLIESNPLIAGLTVSTLVGIFTLICETVFKRKNAKTKTN